MGDCKSLQREDLDSIEVRLGVTINTVNDVLLSIDGVKRLVYDEDMPLEVMHAMLSVMEHTLTNVRSELDSMRLDMRLKPYVGDMHLSKDLDIKF